jgi:hypothetical protein
MRAKPISWYLGTLTEEQEDRLLTKEIFPGCYVKTMDGAFGPCLVGTACDAERFGVLSIPFLHTPNAYLARCTSTPARELRATTPEAGYDHLCAKHGVGRVNAMIRNRIIANRAKRQGLVLEPMRETVVVR